MNGFFLFIFRVLLICWVFFSLSGLCQFFSFLFEYLQDTRLSVHVCSCCSHLYKSRSHCSDRQLMCTGTEHVMSSGCINQLNWLLTPLMLWQDVIRALFGRTDFNGLKSARKCNCRGIVLRHGCRLELRHSAQSSSIMWSIRLNATAENNDRFFVFLSGVTVII